MNRSIARISRDADGDLWATVRYPGGHEQDEPVRQLPLSMLLAYAQGGAVVRDVGEAALGGVISEWQAEWRAQAAGWIDRLNKLGLKWLAVSSAAQKAGNTAVVREAKSKRVMLREVRSWVYTIVDTYLGGVQALGALPQLVIGGVAVVGVAGFAAWLADEEARVERARKDTLVALAQAAKGAPSEVRKALADATRGVVAVWELDGKAKVEAETESSIWPLVMLGVALAGGGVWLARQRGDRGASR